MKVFEVRLKLFLMKDIKVDNALKEINAFIDRGLSKDQRFLDFHKNNNYKNYCFDSLYPIEEDRIYKSGKIYTLTLRSIDEKLAKYFADVLANQYTYTFKGLTSEIRIIPEKHIEKIYSITPVIIKNEEGYWKGNITRDEFEKRIKENLIKKYNNLTSEKISEDFKLFDSLEFKNKKPIATNYKEVVLLGDKLSLNISDNKTAQSLAYISLGTGILEMNSRGFGFVNYRWI